MKSDVQLRQSFRLVNTPHKNLLVLSFFWNEEVLSDAVRVTDLLLQDSAILKAENPGTCFGLIIDTSAYDSELFTLPLQAEKNFITFLKDPLIGKIAFLGAEETTHTSILPILSVFHPGKAQWFFDAGEALAWVDTP